MAIDQKSYSDGRAQFYIQDKPSVDRLISELPVNDEQKNSLKLKLNNIISDLTNSAPGSSEFSKAEKDYKNFKYEIRLQIGSSKRILPNTNVEQPKSQNPSLRKPPINKAKSSAEKDRSFIEKRLEGLTQQLDKLEDNQSVLKAKEDLQALKTEYSKMTDEQLLPFIQTKFGNLTNDINKVIIANKGKLKIPSQQKPATSPEVKPTPVTKNATVSPDVDPQAWLKAHGMDKDEFAEQLNESNALILTIAQETGLPKAELEKFWDLAVQQTKPKNGSKDAGFWSEVMEKFQTLIDKVDIEEAKNIMETRANYREVASQFLDNLADDNFVNASEAFNKMVDSRLSDTINTKAQAYCRDVLAKEAQRLSQE